ncbi:hypothetical protein LIV57_06835 [Chryseobacterium sp. X308]|uniref:hypothetical protein n=1 Tax=Chryseobacterium sp. X308 TaxID=2884873 RepID=UPI001D157564|nr:hypothetical protein [Chryseobacterium sp. X308]MCC3214983.1 hypothetical protein [Chryseobacterium sp. X308]
MEISRESIKYSSANTKEKLVNDILTLFQVRDKNQEKKEMMDTWLLFVLDFRFTATEIYYAHKMAIQRTLLDQNGNEIECLPMLSTNTTGKILKAYERYKQNDKQLEAGREQLKKILNPEPERSPEEIKAEKKKNWDALVEAVKKGEKCEHAFLFYEFAIKKGGLSSFVNDTDGQKIAIKEKMIQILAKEKLKPNSVLFNAFELKQLSEYFEDKKKAMTNDIAFAFDRLHAMAITHVKNDKVYEWVSEQIKSKGHENKS